jgi:hypothetical protein
MTAAWQFASERACCQLQLQWRGLHLMLLLKQQQVPVGHWQQLLLLWGLVLDG